MAEMELCGFTQLIILAVLTQTHTHTQAPALARSLFLPLPFHGERKPGSPPPWPSAAACLIECLPPPRGPELQGGSCRGHAEPSLLQVCAVRYLEMVFFFLEKKSILGSTDTWVPVNNSFKEKVGGRHSDQGFFDKANLLALNLGRGDG